MIYKNIKLRASTRCKSKSVDKPKELSVCIQQRVNKPGQRTSIVYLTEKNRFERGKMQI